MTERSVLISGAGIAGSTLAYWMAYHGWRVTVVELAAGLRSSGNPVDVRNKAVEVASKMGITEALRSAATHATGMRVVDASGRSVARLPMDSGTEIARGDLAAILTEAARPHATFLMGDTITALDQDPGGVNVTFAQAPSARFDLVVGADGLHSRVRRLAFGPERNYVHHLGLYVATVSLGAPSWNPTDVLLYNTPGRLLSVHPGRGEALAAFIFRHPETPIKDQAKFVVSAYEGAGWRTQELLTRLSETDFYFDAVSRVALPSWTQGRVTLAGDAASCVSLFGDGSSLAMAGAHTLAASLALESDMAAALHRYEARHRALTDPKQRHITRTTGLLVPRTRPGLTARNAAARVWSSARAA
ncbi:FAD-dependent monooxygenase [Paractinoplanes atraurantiacus]|uniref:2-polyprenyl-6-methoxyphenol hydroxylase n=1 Tax=Paractinoplanes atraurantiacus TaxID=1036182 RepID=A0A285K7R0_9ACTN|nr:FAD-dependent monooxygenase [Actinoplanes atraurantiacus]SNY68609.1 2-polyprenyl-6-methoxyphenol hydroxylase [Actinoplanes atraurantiacus]